MQHASKLPALRRFELIGETGRNTHLGDISLNVGFFSDSVQARSVKRSTMITTTELSHFCVKVGDLDLISRSQGYRRGKTAGCIFWVCFIRSSSSSSSSCRSPVGHTVSPVFKTKCAVLSSSSCGPYNLTCSAVSSSISVCLLRTGAQSRRPTEYFS